MLENGNEDSGQTLADLIITEAKFEEISASVASAGSRASDKSEDRLRTVKGKPYEKSNKPSGLKKRCSRGS